VDGVVGLKSGVVINWLFRGNFKAFSYFLSKCITILLKYASIPTRIDDFLMGKVRNKFVLDFLADNR